MKERKYMSSNVDVNIWCLTYNHSKYIRQTLESFLMQKTNFTCNIIIYDDASTDDNQKIIQEYVDKYPDKFIAILSDENLYSQGKSFFPIVIPFFTGKYIAICEGDDYWTDPYKLQKQYDIMEANPQYSACYHNIIPIDKNGNVHSNYKSYPYRKEHIFDKNQLNLFRLPGQTATRFMRNVYTELSPHALQSFIDCKMNGDIKTALLLAQYGDIIYLEDAMVAHRMVWDEGESYTAKVHRGEINLYIQRYNNYTEAKSFLKSVFNSEFPDFEYKCEILIEILFFSFKLRRYKNLKTFFELLFLNDYPLHKKLFYLFSKAVRLIKKN